MGRYLGLDIGRKRIGIANSDERKIIAFPHSVYHLNSIEDFIKHLRSLALEKDIERIIIGLPLRTDRKEETDGSIFAREIGEIIGKELGIEVIMYDERLTTLQAQRELTSFGMKQKKQRKVIDMVAAQIILQAYLDSQAV